jgi:hypothetical protein
MNRLSRLDVLLLSIVTLGAWFSAYYATRGSEWVVMTDELQQLKLGTSVADSLSPLPQLHGEHVSALSQLYPLLIAPFVALLRMPAAIDAIHVLNGLLIALAAWPAHRLTLDVTRSRLAAYLVAALTTFMPWTVFSTTLTTPVLAYPIVVWAVLLMERALVAPTPRREGAVLAVLALGVLARTQLLVLFAAYPLAVVVHELGFRHARPRLREHLVLGVATVSGLVVLAAVAGFGRASSLLGSYSVTAHGDLLPAGVWRSTVQHLLNIAVPAAMLPLALAAGWTATVLRAPRDKEQHAYACLMLLIVPLAALQVASFDLRFTPGGFPQGRYLFFIVPLLLVASAACLLEGRRTALPVAVGGAVVAAAIGLGKFGGPPIYWASPSSALQSQYDRLLPGSLETSMRVLTIALTLVAVALLLWAPRRASVAVVLGALLVLFAVEARYVFVEYALPLTQRPLAATAPRADWIDAALPRGSSVALITADYPTPDFWWDVEYWNERVDRAYSLDGATTHTPFPHRNWTLDRRTGLIHGSAPPKFAVFARSDVRFRPQAAPVLAATKSFELRRLPERVRADWATSGLTPDGWTHGEAWIHVYPRTGATAKQREVTVKLSSLGGISRSTTYRIVARGRQVAHGKVAPRNTRTVRFSLCVPPAGREVARLDVRSRSRIVDGRIVGLRVEGIDTSVLGRPCRARE